MSGLVYNNSMLGRAESEFESYQQYPTSGKSDLGKDDFLNLLVEQLKNQDPLNPMEDKEFTAQLANFSSLEQLTEINEGIGDLTAGTQRQEMLNGVSFIGKEVMAAGEGLSKSGDHVSSMSFTLNESAFDVYVNIFDEYGNIVKTLEMGAMQQGEHSIDWDGADYNGSEVPDGIYYVSMAAENSEGEPILVNTEVSGTVKGVNVYSDGYYLQLEDGREVNMLEVQTVLGASKDETGGDGDNGDDEETGDDDT